MNLLLDTQILIWQISGNPIVNPNLRNVIANPNNDVLVSWVSIWEISIKTSLKKLPLQITLPKLEQHLLLSGYVLLDFEFKQLTELQKLPLHHRDPFDRMLIAQGIAENLTIITSDVAFKNYEVDILLNT